VLHAMSNEWLLVRHEDVRQVTRDLDERSVDDGVGDGRTTSRGEAETN